MLCIAGDGETPVSIHAPNEGSDRTAKPISSANSVSIHAPNEGSDPENQPKTSPQTKFQSTLPMKGATL